MDFDTAKENIQPLASGRNVEHLENALHAESDQETQEKLHEQRREFEKAIETYEGDDPLQSWYDYIVWIEQVYPKSGKESALHEILSKCLSLFERDERYFQDRRMVKLYIKYIDSEPNAPQFYEQLYNNGIGTMVADLYLCWAHYYDYLDNFEKTEIVYQKGLNARAQPFDVLEQAHGQFRLSMAHRILYKDESTQKEFRSTMDEQRLALTSLRAHKHRHVGSIRTGSAVKSYNPGRVDQSSSRRSQQKENRKVQVFEDGGEAPTSPVASTSVVQSILNSTKKQENMREPGPWNKAKIKTHPLFSGAGPSKPSFPILEDDDIPPIPLPDSENHYVRGIQLPANFVRKNLPQDEFKFPIHRDEEPAKNTLYKYDKFMLFPAPDKCYSLEELSAYKWYKNRNIANNFTRAQDTVWENGHDIPIRLPPHFVRKNRKQDDDWPANPINYEEALADGKRKFGFDINLIYTPTEEFSPEEILEAKWLNGDLISQRDAEMEITCGFERREEIFNRNAQRRSMVLGGRKSILPRKSNSPRRSMSARKSIAPAPINDQLTADQPEPEASAAPNTATGAIKRTSLPKRKSVYVQRTVDALTTIPESASPPVLRRKLNEDDEAAERHHKPIPPPKFNIFEDIESKEAEKDDNIFKVPQSAPAPKPRISSVFHDEDLDGCTTQTFNFFIKSQSISTPKVDKPFAKLPESEGAATMRKELDFGSDGDASPIKDIDAAAAKQPFSSRIVELEQPYALVEPPEIYRQKLSAIMETTEECATVSSGKSTSAEDFDFTKNTNQQSSVVSTMSTYRQHTIINNTAKMSTSNVSVTTNRENESRKVSALGFEIYQEEPTKVNEAAAIQAQVTAIKMSDSSTNEVRKVPDAFDKTLPPAGQFHVYEDDDNNVENAQNIESNVLEKENSIAPKHNQAAATEQSIFEISHVETAPSNWSSKTLTHSGDCSARRVSVIQTIEKQQDLTLTTTITLPTEQTQSKPAFQIYREDTGLTLPPINFNEDRTEKMPNFFNQSNCTLSMPPVLDHIEAPSIYMPEIPEYHTKHTSKAFKTDPSSVEQPPAIDESAVYDKSVFIFPKEDTTNVFAANFGADPTETASKFPNPLQISMVGNLSAFSMIPEMPTLPEIDFAAEVPQNAMAHSKFQALDQSKIETTMIKDQTIANQSDFHGFRGNTDMYLNRTTKDVELPIESNKSTVGRKTLVEPNIDDVSNLNASKQIDKTAPMKADKSRCESGLIDEQKENKRSGNRTLTVIANNTTAKANESEGNIDDELYAMINTSSKTSMQEEEKHAAISVAEKSTFATKSFAKEQLEKSKSMIDDEFYAMISPTLIKPAKMETNHVECNKSTLSKSKPRISDEFYAMIKSPVIAKNSTLPPAILIVDTPPSPAVPQIKRESIVSDRKTTHHISKLREPSMSLLEPMKQTTIRPSIARDIQNEPLNAQRKSSIEAPRAFSEENPNTAMFSLHMPSIKNSTILNIDHINEVTDELKTSLVIQSSEGPKLMEKSVKPTEEKLANENAEQTFEWKIPAVNVTNDVKANSIHIKEERFSMPNKSAVAEKPYSNIDTEVYECIKENDVDINGYLDLSIQLTEEEMADVGSKTEPLFTQMTNTVSNFVICNPVSIRPSQFPMNETKINDTTIKNEFHQVEQSFKDIQLNPSLIEADVVVKQEEASLIVIEDTDDLSAVCKSSANKTRRDTIHSPFKNRYATNPKLNETISAVKEIDPFDIHLQNAFLDDIDFIEYIRSLDYVLITTRVRLIELNGSLEMADDTFNIDAQIGQGSFGYVYRGKSTKTGKLYAFKQERPANHWEFYISLEIASRIEDPKMLPGFMSVDYGKIGHNSSIFASEFCEYGSLFDVCNRHKLNTCRNLDEAIAMIFSEQMLSIMDHLHASNIIHGDIKPDNFLLMKKLTHGNTDLVIKLIDYGRSIDLNFFPPNQTFTTTINTKNFICTEMMENRPWKHQVDLFCLASTIFTLVCGKYMNVRKQDSKIRPYVLCEGLPSYLDVDVWEDVIYSLINVRDHNSLPDLQKLRLRIRECIADTEESILQDRIAKFNAVLDA